jgi:sugar lactone lactonase YvrE
MVFKKTIVQVFSGKEPFGFDDFVRGTLRLFNYAVDHNIDVRVNISGAEFEPYMIVTNFVYDKINLVPKVYYTGVDDVVLVKNLDAFLESTDPLFVVSSNVKLDRIDIYNLSYIGYDTIVRYKETLYAAAQAKVLANLLYRPYSDNLLYGYNIIYIDRDELQYKITNRSLASLANQIRQSLDMNKDMMVFSNSIQLQKILSQYIEMSSFAVQKIDDSDIDISVQESLPTIEDTMIDFIILMKSKKIYRFADTVKINSHTLKSSLTNLYDTAFDINTLIGNLEITSIPLYYGTYTLAGYASSSPKTQPGLITDSSGTRSLLNNPSGITLDSSGNIYFSDTLNHRICKLDVSGNFSTYAGSTNGTPGLVNGSNLQARFNNPTAIAIDRKGNIYVADTGNNAIRIIQLNTVYDSSGNTLETNRLVNILVGTGPNSQKFSSIGFSNSLNAPKGVAVDISGNIYISDTGNHRICKVTSGGSLETLAGKYLSGNLNDQGQQASFKNPTGLCVDVLGNIFVTDTGNNMIKRITPSGKVSIVAGNGQPFFKEGKRLQAGFCRPTGITVDLQNILYVTDTGNNVIRRITTDGNVLPVVGSSQQLPGSIDGFGAVNPTRSLVPFEQRATFYGPSAIAVDSNRLLYIADTQNNTIRKIVPTFSTPTKIKPIAIQALRIFKSYGITNTLGPSLTESPKNSMVYGHKRGTI